MDWYRRLSAGVVVLFLVVTGSIHGQGLEQGPYSLRVQIVSPTSAFSDPFEVQLLHDSVRPVAEVIMRPQEYHTFRGLSGGTYVVAVDIKGFKKVRQRIDLISPQNDTSLSVILESQESTPTRELADLSGDESGVVDVSDLARLSPELQDAIQTAEHELRRGNHDDARRRLESIVEEVPEVYTVRELLGEAYQRAHRYRDAEAEYRAARDLKPGSAAPFIRLGSLYLEEAEAGPLPGANTRAILSNALGSLLSAAEMNPRAAFAYYLLGVTYYRAALYEDAEENLIHAMELEPRLGAARLALANVYIQIQEWPNALTQIDTYLTENSDAPDACHIRQIRSRIERVLRSDSVRSITQSDPCGEAANRLNIQSDSGVRTP